MKLTYVLVPLLVSLSISCVSSEPIEISSTRYSNTNNDAKETTSTVDGRTLLIKKPSPIHQGAIHNVRCTGKDGKSFSKDEPEFTNCSIVDGASCSTPDGRSFKQNEAGYEDCVAGFGPKSIVPTSKKNPIDAPALP